MSILSPSRSFGIILFRRVTGRTVRKVCRQKRVPVIINKAKFCVRTLLCSVSFARGGTSATCQRRLRTLTGARNTRRLRRVLRGMSPRSTRRVRFRGMGHIVHTLRCCRRAKRGVSRRGRTRHRGGSTCGSTCFILASSHGVLCSQVSGHISLVVRRKLLRRIGTLELHKLGERDITVRKLKCGRLFNCFRKRCPLRRTMHVVGESAERFTGQRLA